jgi:hypothetical protein
MVQLSVSGAFLRLLEDAACRRSAPRPARP